MKFKVGDTVKVVAGKERLHFIGVDKTVLGKSGEVTKTEPNEDVLTHRVNFPELNAYWWFNDQDLELVEGGVEQIDNETIRKFETGATRDTTKDKLDFEGFISPLVSRRYAQYLHKHRVQSDGTMRDSDNWQKGMSLDVYIKSKIRHGNATHLIHDGFKAYDEKGSEIDLEESLCAELFNTMGYLFEILKEKEKTNVV